LGKRAAFIKIREGEQQAVISAFFDTTEHLPKKEQVNLWFEKHFFVQNPQELFIRRVLDRSGKSRVWINGQSCALNQIRELGELLLEINGQHSHQKLNSASYQKDLLDEYASLNHDRKKLRSFWELWQSSKEKLDILLEEQSTIKQKREVLAWKISELEKLNLLEGEWEIISSKHAKISKLSETLTIITSCSDALDRDNGLVSRLEKISSDIEGLIEDDEALREISTTFEKGIIELQEACSGLKRYRTAWEIDESQIQEIERRFDEILATSQKVKQNPELLQETLLNLKEELIELDNDMDISELEKKVNVYKSQYFSLANEISRKRKTVSVEFSSIVTNWFKKLSMQNFIFSVSVRPEVTPNSTGIDAVSFEISQFEGKNKQKITQTASGGELSRIMLAITMAISDVSRTPTMIFDEIDAGIGGNTGDSVGEVLKLLGEEQQVFCITHLPQIAARGSNQFQIQKKIIENRPPITEIKELAYEERIKEIARMLGDEFAKDTSIEHAKSLLSTHCQRISKSQ
jgi:DNA repair protein RecN (Recombination protein N)